MTSLSPLRTEEKQTRNWVADRRSRFLAPLPAASQRVPVDMDRSDSIFPARLTDLSKSIPPEGGPTYEPHLHRSPIGGSTPDPKDQGGGGLSGFAAAVPSLIPFLVAPSAFACRRNHLPHFAGEDT